LREFYQYQMSVTESDPLVESASPQQPSAKKQRMEIDEEDIVDSDMEKEQKTITLEQYKAGAVHLGNGNTGPGSIWLYAKRDSSVDSQSLSSHMFDPSKPLAGYKLPEKEGASCPYGLVAHALDLIEALKASGSGSRKKTIVVLTNLFRLILIKYKNELIHAIYLIINKVGPDYEGLELGVGDQIVMRAMAEAYGRKESDLKAMIDRGTVSDLGEAALESRVKQSMLMQPAPLTVAKVFKDLRSMA
jgi:DNA ligase-1